MTDDPVETIEHLLVEPQYGDMYLRFQDEEEAFLALYTTAIKVTTVTDDEGSTATIEEPIPGEFVPRYGMAIDTIGVIHKAIGDMDAEGNFLTAALPGWHVNLRGTFTEEQMAELEVFKVEPTNPVRVWA